MPDHAVIVPGESLPTTNTLIPTGIALAIFAPLTVILDIAPLLWHIRNRNVAAISLVAWIMLHNFISFVNLLIWPTDDFKDHYIGEGLCDVEVKFMVARSVAIPAASLCIIRALARVMNTDKGVLRPTRAQRRRAIVMDLVWCIGCPLISMFLHYVVQPNRYFLLGVSGCTPSFWASWLSILLMCLPPLFLSLANSYFASMSIHFQSRLVANSTKTSSPRTRTPPQIPRHLRHNLKERQHNQIPLLPPLHGLLRPDPRAPPNRNLRPHNQRAKPPVRRLLQMEPSAQQRDMEDSRTIPQRSLLRSLGRRRIWIVSLHTLRYGRGCRGHVPNLAACSRIR